MKISDIFIIALVIGIIVYTQKPKEKWEKTYIYPYCYTVEGKYSATQEECDAYKFNKEKVQWQ